MFVDILFIFIYLFIYLFIEIFDNIVIYVSLIIYYCMNVKVYYIGIHIINK